MIWCLKHVHTGQCLHRVEHNFLLKYLFSGGKKQYLSIFNFFLVLIFLSPPLLENFSSFTKCDFKNFITYTKGSFKLIHSHR